MKSSIRQLASAVATLLGEALELEGFPVESPFPDIEKRVRILAPVILSELYSEAPSASLPCFWPIETPFAVDSAGYARVELPADFMRLASLRLTDWKRPVTDVSSSSTCRNMQASLREGIHGNPDRPVALLDIDPMGTRCLVLYSASPSSRLDHAFYIPVPAVDTSDCVTYPETFHAPILTRLEARIASRMT